MTDKVKRKIIAEYLEIFSKDGDFSVDVKFESGTKRAISKRNASSNDICNVIQLLSNQSVDNTYMSFDDYPCAVTDISIDLARKQVYLKVSEL